MKLKEKQKSWYLVQEGHVDEAVVEHQRFLCTKQLSEQRSDMDPTVIRSSLGNKNQCTRTLGNHISEDYNASKDKWDKNDL